MFLWSRATVAFPFFSIQCFRQNFCELKFLWVIILFVHQSGWKSDRKPLSTKCAKTRYFVIFSSDFCFPKTFLRSILCLQSLEKRTWAQFQLISDYFQKNVAIIHLCSMGFENFLQNVSLRIFFLTKVLVSSLKLFSTFQPGIFAPSNCWALIFLSLLLQNGAAVMTCR